MNRCKDKERRQEMDRYSEIMLEDDINTKEETDILCLRCQSKIRIKVTDQFVSCMKCGESFYLELLDENNDYY